MEQNYKVAKANTMMFDNSDELLAITKKIIVELSEKDLTIGMIKAILKDAIITVNGISNNKYI